MIFPAKDKVVPLEQLVSLVSSGSSLALGGSFLHRSPFAFVRELIRKNVSDLEIIKQSPGYDIDILCRAKLVKKIRAGIVAIEGNFGLAPSFRGAVERAEVVLEEHACASLTAGLRASAFGVPFQPCAGFDGSDIPALNGWTALLDPYESGKKTWVIPAIQPDFAIIHANEVDRCGNVRVFGSSHWDRIMSRASKSVLVTAEKLVDTDQFKQCPEATLIPFFMVQAVSIVNRGAWPGSCWPHYSVNYPAVESYLVPGESALKNHLNHAPEVSKVSQ